MRAAGPFAMLAASRRRLPGPLAALLVLALAAVLFASALAGPALAQTAPAAPTGLTATPGDAQVVLNWTDPSNSSITKYQTRQSTDGGSTWNPDWADIAGSDATTTSHTVSILTYGTTYTFELRAVAGTTNGASASVSATPAAALVHNLGKQCSDRSRSRPGDRSKTRPPAGRPGLCEGYS